MSLFAFQQLRIQFLFNYFHILLLHTQTLLKLFEVNYQSVIHPGLVIQLLLLIEELPIHLCFELVLGMLILSSQPLHLFIYLLLLGTQGLNQLLVKVVNRMESLNCVNQL